jgi:hypothetical protein
MGEDRDRWADNAVGETENEFINNSETKTFREKREPMGTNYRWGDIKTEKLIGTDRWLGRIGDSDTGR